MLFYLSLRIVEGFRPLPLYETDRISGRLTCKSSWYSPCDCGSSGIWDPRFDQDSEKSLLEKSEESLTRSWLSCDWKRYKHWCKFQHFTNCIREEQVENLTSIAYLSTGGRLGNAMSTYAAMLALRHQFGINAMVDLTTYQLLDMVFNNVREVPIIEEEVCNLRDLTWTKFDDHIRHFNTSVFSKGKAILIWPQGIASEENIHGAAQFYIPSVPVIRNAFTFRQRFTDKVEHRLREILADYTTRVNKKRKHKKISTKSCSLVCVHIRRGDHLEYEESFQNISPGMLLGNL